MREVIEKLEAASEGSRELDVAIGQALGAKTVARLGDWDWKVLGWESLPLFTTSLDAALALAARVLPDANNIGFDRSPAECRAWVGRNFAPPKTPAPWDQEAVAATPALALCIAILKAHPSKSIRGGADADPS